MKNTILVLTLLLVQTFAFGQSKKEILDAKDSLMTLSKKDSIAIDSLTKRVTALTIVYESVKTKVLKYNFDPTKFDGIMDSLIANKDAIMTLTNHEKDSLHEVIASLTAKKDSADAVVKYYTDKRNSQTVSDADIIELKKLKDLVDSGILAQDEFDHRRRIILGEPEPTNAPPSPPAPKAVAKP